MSDMINQWKVFKDKESEYKELRLRIEEEILAAHPNEKKVGNIRIAYRDTVKVDSEAVAKLDLPFLPFKVEYKPIAAEMQTMQEHYPEHYRKVQDCLTVTPAKPSFTWKEGE